LKKQKKPSLSKPQRTQRKAKLEVTIQGSDRDKVKSMRRNGEMEKREKRLTELLYISPFLSPSLPFSLD
jgi:hypothetical protein